VLPDLRFLTKHLPVAELDSRVAVCQAANTPKPSFRPRTALPLGGEMVKSAARNN
jgi:hypothetical protein